MTSNKASGEKAIHAANALLELKLSVSNAIAEEIKHQGLNQSRVSEKCGVSRPKVSQIIGGQFSNEFKAELLIEMLLTLNPSRKIRLEPLPKLLWEKTGDKITDLKYKLSSAICHEIDKKGYSTREAAQVAGWSNHSRLAKIKNGDLTESKIDSLYQMLIRLNPSYNYVIPSLSVLAAAPEAEHRLSSKRSSDIDI